MNSQSSKHSRRRKSSCSKGAANNLNTLSAQRTDSVSQRKRGSSKSHQNRNKKALTSVNFDVQSSEMLASRLLRHEKPPLGSNFMTLNPGSSSGHGTLMVDREP